MEKLDKQKLLNYLTENIDDLNIGIDENQQDKTKIIAYFGAILGCQCLIELINNGIFDIE